MIIGLNNLSHRLKTLLDRLTNDRAAGINFLTSISSWTSNTNTYIANKNYYTSALATKLSNYSSCKSKSILYTATGNFTFTVPTTTSIIWLTLQGAGASGNSGSYASSSNYTHGGGGGGSGALIYRMPIYTTAGAVLTGSIGTGGSGTTGDGTFGNGGTSSVFNGITATGGSSNWHGNGGGGGGFSNIDNGGYSFTTNFRYFLHGVSGGNGYDQLYSTSAAAGANLYLYNGGSVGNSLNGGGAASFFANGGNGAASGQNGNAGSLGSGGGGCYINNTSGAGGNGLALIEWVG